MKIRLRSLDILLLVFFLGFSFLSVLGQVKANPKAENGFTEKEIEFGSSSFRISGSIISPITEGKHPAIVFLHGSSPLTRDGFCLYAIKFAKLGFVSLIFDRRGAGRSGGDRFATSLDDMADDAQSGIELLKKQENVDSKRIGYWAISQGGWVATQTASGSKDVAFMIIVSGGGASPKESELVSYLGKFQRAGLTPSEIAQGLSVITEFFNYLETGKGYGEVQSLVSKSKDAPWYKYAQIGNIIPTEENRQNWKWVASFNPVPLMKRIKCPVLLMFGERDKDHPTDLAARKWREGLGRAGNDNVTIVVFPGAGHGIRMRDDYNGQGRAPFADGYSELMLGWLWQHVLKVTK